MARYCKRNEAEDRMIAKLDYKTHKTRFDAELAEEFAAVGDKEIDPKMRKALIGDLAMRHLAGNMSEAIVRGDRKQQEYYMRNAREYCVERTDKVKDAVVDSMKFLCEAVAMTRGLGGGEQPRLIEAVVGEKPKKKVKGNGRKESSGD